MHLEALRLVNFRNFADQTLELPPGGVAIVGDNGQGKTNLLEAIYYLEIFRSFRGAPDEQLVRFGETVFRVQGRVRRGHGSLTVAAGYDRRQKRKKVTLDGAEPPRIGDALGRIGVVLFSPTDVAIVSGSPSLRRRFLDILLSLTEPGYLENLQKYRHILLQRNSLLRAGEPRDLVIAWNPGLVRAGSAIVAARLAWIAAVATPFAERVSQIAGGTDALLEYDPSLPLPPGPAPPDRGAIGALFSESLERVAEREVRRGTTLAGPHLDDLRIRAAGGAGGEWVDLRVFGSGGQQRTAAVALRMVEAETLRQHLGSDPLILLDDVFAELDVGRSRRILEWVEVERDAQVVLTAPKPADFDLRGGSLPLWRISAGTISPL
jgi:DNA replication and repair protein RecF